MEMEHRIQSPGLSMRSVTAVLAALSLLVVVSLLALYVTQLGRPHFSSDDAVLNLMAESVHDQGSLFPEGWVTNNGDLMMPSGVLLIAPLLHWWPNSYALHAVAGIFAVGAVLSSFLFFLICARLPAAIVLVATTILASGLSWLSAILLYLQTTYAWWPVAFFLCAALIVQQRTRPAIRRGTLMRLTVLFLVVFSIAFANPGRVAVMVILPLYAFDRWLAWRLATSDNEVRGVRSLFRRLGAQDFVVLFGIGAAFIAATTLYYWLMSAGIVSTAHNASKLHWDGYTGVVKHAGIFVKGWFEYLGGMREANAPNGILEHIFQPLRTAFAIWLSWIGLAEIASLRKPGHPVRRALAAALLVSFVPVLFMYLAFSPLASDTGTTRYFTVPILILLGLAAFRLAATSGRWRRFVPGAVVVASVLIVPICLLRFVPSISNPALGLLETSASTQMKLADVLIRENLRWGYATWWNAGATTIHSEMKARVNPVGLSGPSVAAFPVMTQRRWYDPKQWVGESFLALSRSEASPDQLSALRPLLGDPERVVETPEYVVLVYANNIAGDFVCSSRSALDAALDSTVLPGRIASAELLSDAAGAAFGLARIVVSNGGKQMLDGIGRYPVSIGMQLFDAAGQVMNPDWVHFPLPCSVPVGGKRTFLVPLPAKLPPGARVEVDLVQEQVAWFAQWGAATARLVHERN